MPDTRFDWFLAVIGVVFTVVSVAVIFPQFASDGLDLGTAADGLFGNAYAAVASIDVIFTYVVLAAWVIYEYQYRGVQHGWISLVVGLVIGVAAGLVVYLLVRHREIGPQTWR